MRLDAYLVEHNEVQSRNKAQEIIDKSLVLVNGKSDKKNSYNVQQNDVVEVLESHRFVSRAGEKLFRFLEENPLHVQGCEALDVGSSTGGFTQVLLESGVKSVTCVDSGSDQLHESLRIDERISLFEKTNINDFTSQKKFEIITCDVSFVSVINVMDSINNLAKDMIIILFKPQFEVGVGAKRDKKGVVKDALAISLARKKFEINASMLGWQLVVVEESKVKGKEGNAEFFYVFKKG